MPELVDGGAPAVDTSRDLGGEVPGPLRIVPSGKIDASGAFFVFLSGVSRHARPYREPGWQVRDLRRNCLQPAPWAPDAALIHQIGEIERRNSEIHEGVGWGHSPYLDDARAFARRLIQFARKV